MTNRSSSSHPTPINSLVEGDDRQIDQWFAMVTASLSSEALLQLEAEAYELIDKRYPDDPGSLLNLRHREGQRRKKTLRAHFDQAQDQLQTDRTDHLENVRRLALAHHRSMVDLNLYQERRQLQLVHEADTLKRDVTFQLGHDLDLQRQLVLDAATDKGAFQQAEAEARRERERLKLEQRLDRKAQRLAAKLERARRKLEQPHELNLALRDFLTSLLKFQMLLNDRAMRNPALADRLRMVGMGLTTSMAAVQRIIGELNQAGDVPTTPERLQQQVEDLLSMFTEQVQQWQHDIRSEPDL